MCSQIFMDGVEIQDMGLAKKLGENTGVALPVCAATDGSMLAAMQAGHADLDFSATYEGQKKK